MGEDREDIRNRRALGSLGSWGAGTEEDQKLAILFFLNHRYHHARRAFEMKNY